MHTRREFLRGLGALVGGLVGSRVLPRQEQEPLDLAVGELLHSEQEFVTSMQKPPGTIVGLFRDGYEISGAGYARVLADGPDVVFPTAGEDWGTVTHIALFRPGFPPEMQPVGWHASVCRHDTVRVFIGHV